MSWEKLSWVVKRTQQCLAPEVHSLTKGLILCSLNSSLLIHSVILNSKLKHFWKHSLVLDNTDPNTSPEIFLVVFTRTPWEDNTDKWFEVSTVHCKNIEVNIPHSAIVSHMLLNLDVRKQNTEISWCSHLDQRGCLYLHEVTWIFFGSNQVMFICVSQLSATTEWRSELQVVFLLLLTHHRHGPCMAIYMETLSIHPTWAVVLNTLFIVFLCFSVECYEGKQNRDTV